MLEDLLKKTENGAPKLATAHEVVAFAREKGMEMVDLKFIDLPGTWQHFTVPMSQLSEKNMAAGYGFDGSSIRGFQHIHESDMLLVPDATTTVIDKVCQVPTLSLICDVRDPVTGKDYSRDPRYVARKAEAFLKQSGIATVSYWGPELEFFIFDDIRYGQDQHSGYYYVDSVEGSWNTGRDEKPNLGYKPRYKEGYFPVPPTDSLQDIRSAMVLALQEAGIEVEAHHHEVATAGQNEIDMRFDSLTRMADNVMTYKYITKNVARRHGKTVTFMPKPLFQDNGSGMHVHQSLWKDETNIFFDAKGYALLSDMALRYTAGLIQHASVLLALCAPTTNSYRRLVPGYEAPVNLAYSQRNRSACVRVPMYSSSASAKRLEFRPPDGSCNPYLAFAAMLMAGLDGIINKMDPGKPLDVDLYEPALAGKVKQVPGSLGEVLDALEADHEFLLRGGVFTEDLLETWIAYKRSKELDEVRLRPHPWEFHLYFDA